MMRWQTIVLITTTLSLSPPGFAADSAASAKTAASKSVKKKKTVKTALDELRLVEGDEQGNEVKSLKAELMVSKTEEQAIAQALKLLKRHKGTPLEPEIDRIRKLTDKAQLAGEIAHLHRIGIAALFEFGSGQDFKDSTAVVAQLDQGRLGLPDRDYYLKDDAKSVELRQKYQAHVQRMFELAGQQPERAKTLAETVMRIETELAKASLDLVSRRDPEKVYHPM